MKKFILALLCCCTFSLGLSACSEANTSNTAREDGDEIGEEEAKAIAMKKVPGAQGENVTVKKGEAEGTDVYQGTVEADGAVYEFEIEAATGAVLKWREK